MENTSQDRSWDKKDSFQNISEQNQGIKQINTKFWVKIRVYKQMRYIIKQDLV